MKKLNLWKLLFSALTVFAATTFSACVDDNEDNGMPYIEVSPETLSFTLDGVAENGTAFEVHTNRPWTLTPHEDSEWVTIEKTEGYGDATVEISVPGALEGRVAVLDFQLSNPYGAYMTKTVYVKQGDVQIPGVLPTQVVTEFGDDFTAVENGTVYESPFWTFTSSDSGYPANPKLGWFGTVYDRDGSRYLQCAPYSSKLSSVTCYAIMTPFNVKAAADKTVDFKLAWYANKEQSSIDGTKVEVVASSTVTDETVTDDGVWTVLQTIQYKDGDAMNTYNPLTADLSPFANDEKVYVAFRYVGHNNTYRLDDVSFNGGKPSTLVVEPETLAIGSTEGATATVKVTATDPWEATIASGSGFTIENGSGSGDGEFIVKASAGNDTADEKQLGTISVTSVAGTKTVTVKQKGQSNDIYYESFGLPVKGDNWPFADVYTGYSKQGYGFVDGTTTYDASSTSVRQLKPETNSPVPPCSGEGHCWFPTGKTYATNYFEVNKLVMPNETNISFEFVVKGNSGAYKDGDLKFEISADGETWKELTFSVGTIPGLAEGASTDWTMAKKDITLKSAIEFLYVRWSSATTNGVRIDDPRIYVGSGGEEIDFGAPVGPTVSAVAASKITQTTATIGGELKNAQTGDYSEVGVQYAEKPAAGDVNWADATKKAAATVASPWSVDLTGLTHTTAYVFRAYATPKTGEVLYSAEATFTTLAPEIEVTGDVIVKFTGADIATPALPLSDAVGTTAKTYTIGGYQYTIASSRYYLIDNEKYDNAVPPYTALYLKGSTADAPAYVELPAISGKKLTKIELVPSGGLGSSVMLSVRDAAGTVISGGESKEFKKAALTTFTLTGTEADVAYRIYVDAKNAQINKIGLTYEDASGPVQLKLNPGTAEMEFAAAADLTGKTQAYTITGDATGLTLFTSVADATNFSAEVQQPDGKTVLVKALTANDGAAARETTVTVYLAESKEAEKKATATINVTQAAKVAEQPLTVAQLVAKYIAGEAVATNKVRGYVAAFVPNGTNNADLAAGNLIIVDNDGGEYSGIQFYGNSKTLIGGATLSVGDQVEIDLAKAVTNTKNGLRQYEKVEAADVKVLASGTAISYKSLTAAQIATDFDKYMSVPVKVEQATPAADDVWKTFNSELQFSDATGSFTVYGRSGWADGEKSYVANTTGTIQGILSVYNNPQLIPMTLDDVRPFIVTTPLIGSLKPSSLTWAYDLTVGQTIDVEGANLTGATVSAESSAGGSSNFNISVSGLKITVTPKGVNNSGADFVETLTVSVPNGNQKTLTLTQLAMPAAGAMTLSLETKSDEVTNFPTTSSTSEELVAYAKGYRWGLFNARQNSGYLFITGTNGYLATPAVTGKTLKTIKFKTSNSLSAKAKATIKAADGTVVSPEQAVGTKNTTFTFELTGAAVNTSYRINSSSSNTQIVSLELIYE